MGARSTSGSGTGTATTATMAMVRAPASAAGATRVGMRPARMGRSSQIADAVASANVTASRATASHGARHPVRSGDSTAKTGQW